MSRLKKKAAEMLDEQSAAVSFNENLDEVITAIENAKDCSADAAMFMDMLENDHFLEAPEDIRLYLSNLIDYCDSTITKIDNFKQQLTNGQKKFIINH
jgi:hypothetical protein